MAEDVPAKKKIGVLAAKHHEEKKASGDFDVIPFPDDVNCDLDRRLA